MSLSVRAIETRYGAAKALDGVSIEVADGEVVALLGRNGAGKSTTVKAIVGLVPLVVGDVRLDDISLARLPANERARLGIGYVPEERRIFAGLTVAENLEVGRQKPRAGAPTWTEGRIATLFPALAVLRDRAGGQLSGGEQQMLAIARTLMGNPRVLLLDEPSEGLAPRLVEAMADAVIALKAEGLTVVLAEQNLRFAARVADRAYVLARGRIARDGPMETILADRDALRTYLSVGA